MTTYAEQYAAAQEVLAEPAFIKQALPIAFVAEQAGMRLIAGEGRLHAICPFHPDTDPSFDIYPWGGGERFGCFACGAGGDVLDFIQRMWRLGFRDACEMGKRGVARMKALGWERPVLGAVFEWNEAAATEMYRRGGLGGLEEIVANKGWCFSPEHLSARWGCRSMGDQLLVPVWDETKALVGIKHRPLNGARSLISLPGSRLRTTLYGAHRGLRMDGYAMPGPVLLCEGESDAWTASWLLQDRHMNVLSLPAGCGAAPARLDLLRGRRVYIAFDGDDPGRMSAGRWKDALGDAATVLALPDGEDITSTTKAEPTWLAARLTEVE